MAHLPIQSQCLFCIIHHQMTWKLVKNIESIIMSLAQLGWSRDNQGGQILQVPLQFYFEPVEIISKQLTKLNSSSPYRMIYLGPRWGNSFLFHKMYSQKHGYPYDLSKVNRNNNFFSESMHNNQFYRNQIYYRAFEGMNPTLQQDQPIFDSKFQSGNLDCVVKVSDNEYDLFLRIDSNTRGHLFWYYFSISNGKPGQKIKLNLCNLTKQKSLYNKKLQPYVLRQNAQNPDNTEKWSQDKVTNITFEQKKLRYEFIYDKIKGKSFYELSFTYTFVSSEQVVKFAYCIPYTYTDLSNELKLYSEVVQVGTLGRSLTGVSIPLLKIGSDTQEKRKPLILITGRVHPGQSNGSIVLSGLMRFLCLSPEAQFLRKKAIFLIIPMMNPDGVIIGNARTGASGKDLNREFRSLNETLFPQVQFIKRLVRKVLTTHEIEFYLDFHGHSNKKNMFFFGPPYNITQVEYYRSRVLPKILAGLTPMFRYFGSNFAIPDSKKSTARAIMFHEFKIPFVYTVESSIGFYRDYQSNKDMPFTQKQWESLGQKVGLALKEYCEGMDQYEQFLEQRRINKAKTNKKGQKMTLEPNKATNIKLFSIKPNQLKIIKIYEQIKGFEEKNVKKSVNVNDDDSDASSDSHNEDQNLEKKMMKEFEGMIVEGVEFQTSYQEKRLREKQLASQKLLKPLPMKVTKREEAGLMDQIFNDTSPPKNSHILPQRNLVLSQRHNRNRKGSQEQSEPKLKLQKIPLKKQQLRSFQIKIMADDLIHYCDRGQKVSNYSGNNNVTIFNFSRMIQNPRSLRYNEGNSYEKLFYCHKKNQTIQEIPIINKSTRLNHVTLFQPASGVMNSEFEERMSHNIDATKSTKARYNYPSSFYRIKYQAATNRKKRRNQSDIIPSKNHKQVKDIYESQQKKIFLNIKQVKQ